MLNVALTGPYHVIFITPATKNSCARTTCWGLQGAFSLSGMLSGMLDSPTVNQLIGLSQFEAAASGGPKCGKEKWLQLRHLLIAVHRPRLPTAQSSGVWGCD